MQSYHKKLQTKHSEVSRYRGELQEQYENLKNEWGTDIAKLHAETSDTADGFSNEIPVDEEETVPARKSIAFTVDLNPPVVQPVNKEVSLQSSQSSVKTKSFLDGGNTTVDASVAAADVSAGLIDKSGDSFLEQNNELSAEGDSMLSNTFLNEMEELKSNLALDSSQNSMNAQQSSVCYNSSKEPLRVDPETPQATEPVETENEKPSCEVKKKSSSLISKFIKKSRSLSRSRKDKKKKPP
ncbi:unnamed protein product [Auanema sp. JU1783]|nr:unnamed protein product [Auanema sp. JU1783]